MKFWRSALLLSASTLAASQAAAQSADNGEASVLLASGAAAPAPQPGADEADCPAR